MNVKYGIIGGSGLYNIEGIKMIEEIDIPTPFGMPSDYISIADVDGVKVAFLPRHGKGHRLTPTEVPSKANIWAMKSLGVEHIISISAVGSLIEEYKPGDFVVCNQIIDRTKSRPNSYFGEGMVGHVAYGDPLCKECNDEILNALETSGLTYHPKGTLITMEGPLFSTRAESHMYRSWNAHVIGMTALPEAKLAREAEICFSIIAMVTDYDCWREEEEAVTVEMVMETMKTNTTNAQKIIPGLIKGLENKKACSCGESSKYAVITAQEMIPFETKRKLNLFFKKYWG